MNLDASGYRLPTLAEWEFACKGGKATVFYWGNREEDYEEYEWAKLGETGDKRSPMHPVGLKRPNPYGLFDIMGNADEWVNDVTHDSKDSLPAADPLVFVSNAKSHVNVGVSSPRNDLLYSAIGWAPSVDRTWTDIGFRCVRTID